MSSIADTEMTRVVNVSKGQLEYQTSASGQWLPLQSYENDREPQSTIHEIILREKVISFVQHACGGALSCNLKLSPLQYGSLVKIGTVESGQSQQSDIVLELTREKACLTSCCRSASAGKTPQHTVQQCPLARLCQSFSAMRLCLPRDSFEPKLKSSSGPKEYCFKIVNALRRDLNTAPQPSLGTASVGNASDTLSSSEKSSPLPSATKVDTPSWEERFNTIFSSRKNSAPLKKASTSVQQAVVISEPQRTPAQKAPAQHSKVQTSPPAATFVQKPSVPKPSVQAPSVQKPTTTPHRQTVPPDPKSTSSPAVKSVQKPPSTPQKQPIPPVPKQISSSVQPPPPALKQTSNFVQPTPPKSEKSSAFVQPVPPKSKQASSIVKRPPTSKQTSTFAQPTPPKSEETAAFVQPSPPKSKQASSIVRPTPPDSKQSSESAQPPPSVSKQTSTFVQPPPPGLKQASAFVQPTPSRSKQISSHPAKPVQKPPTTPQRQPVPPEPPKPKQTAAFVQPAPPKSNQTSKFAHSQGFLIPQTVNQKPSDKPKVISPPPRKIIDYKDLDSVVAVPSGLTTLDYGSPSVPKQKGSARESERPKWEASIMQLQKLKEAAELEGDKAMAEKASKMIKIFEADAASPGKETKAKVDNFKTMWTLM